MRERIVGPEVRLADYTCDNFRHFSVALSEGMSDERFLFWSKPGNTLGE